MAVEELVHLRDYVGQDVVGVFSATGGGSGGLQTVTRAWVPAIARFATEYRLASATPNAFRFDGRQGPDPGAWFAPHSVASPERVLRMRGDAQCDFPTAAAGKIARCLWGMFLANPSGNDVVESGAVGFRARVEHPSTPTWIAVVSDRDGTVRLAFDTGVDARVLRHLRVDLNREDSTIDFYIDEVLQTSFAVTAATFAAASATLRVVGTVQAVVSADTECALRMCYGESPVLFVEHDV